MLKTWQRLAGGWFLFCLFQFISWNSSFFFSKTEFFTVEDKLSPGLQNAFLRSEENIILIISRP